ncbi:hypothetical protein CPAV1605_481 [seawater metagenome]|uniref:Uncharacterized protein n=1 Tax=seawater metagenome TaxID=1561972 RepID=A0A5E8CI51_9ZZZZ
MFELTFEDKHIIEQNDINSNIYNFIIKSFSKIGELVLSGDSNLESITCILTNNESYNFAFYPEKEYFLLEEDPNCIATFSDETFCVSEPFMNFLNYEVFSQMINLKVFHLNINFGFDCFEKKPNKLKKLITNDVLMFDAGFLDGIEHIEILDQKDDYDQYFVKLTESLENLPNSIQKLEIPINEEIWSETGDIFEKIFELIFNLLKLPNLKLKNIHFNGVENELEKILKKTIVIIKKYYDKEITDDQSGIQLMKTIEDLFKLTLFEEIPEDEKEEWLEFIRTSYRCTDYYKNGNKCNRYAIDNGKCKLHSN